MVAETLSVPTHDRGRIHHMQSTLPAIPYLGQDEPEQPIAVYDKLKIASRK